MTNLYEEIYKLKTLLRKGWVIRSACKDRYESDAEHIFSSCILALEIINKEHLSLNQEKVLKMILYHEIGEIDAGDFTPKDKITKEEKYNLERIGVSRISQECNMPEILDLWLEFEENKTPEAQFVKRIDKLDAIMQSQIYEKQIDCKGLSQEFYETSKDIVCGFDKYIFNNKEDETME